MADTLTEAFLFVATRRVKGRRTPAILWDTAGRPICGRFSPPWRPSSSARAGFAILRGVEILVDGEPRDAAGAVPFLVLVFAFVLEGASLRRSVRQAGTAAQRVGVPLPRYLRVTSDTALKAVFLEDLAALAGLVIAAGGLGLWRLTDDPRWDGAASLVMGLLLVTVALSLAATNGSLLTG